MKASFLHKTDLSSRKQRVRLLVLCSLGVVVILLGVLLVLLFFPPPVPRWYRAHYAAGRVPATAEFAARQGLHLSRRTLGSSMQDDVVWLRVGTNVWALEMLTPIN
jgi:hypothetical protein